MGKRLWEAGENSLSLRLPAQTAPSNEGAVKEAFPHEPINTGQEQPACRKGTTIYGRTHQGPKGHKGYCTV